FSCSGSPRALHSFPTRRSSDLALLARRFEAFEGIANGPRATIENGIDRLALDLAASPDAENARTLARVRDREGVAAKWRTSLGRSEEHTSELQSRRDLVCRLLL